MSDIFYVKPSLVSLQPQTPNKVSNFPYSASYESPEEMSHTQSKFSQGQSPILTSTYYQTPSNLSHEETWSSQPTSEKTEKWRKPSEVGVSTPQFKQFPLKTFPSFKIDESPHASLKIWNLEPQVGAMSFHKMTDFNTAGQKKVFMFQGEEEYDKNIIRSHCNPSEETQERKFAACLFSEFQIRRKKESQEHLVQCEQRRIFLSLNILNCVVDFLDCSDLVNLQRSLKEYRRVKLYKKIFKTKILNFLVQGLSLTNEYNYWSSFVNFKQLKQTFPLEFTRQYVKNSPFKKDMEKDLDRTLPDQELFSTEEGKSDLLRVLIAVANSEREVGYVQGLNSIAGALLSRLKDDESFWMILYMLRVLNIKDMLKEDFSRINILNYQFQAYFENYLPEVADYFESNAISSDYFTNSWWITLFSQCLSLSNVFKVWNLILYRGVRFLIQFALAIFSLYKNVIIQMEVDQVGSFLKQSLENSSSDVDSLFQRALNFKVTKRQMSELEEFYKTNKPQLKLSPNKEDRPQWTTAEISKSLNDLNLSENDQEKSIYDSYSRFDVSSQTSRGDTVNKLKNFLQSPFKQFFSKGGSMRDVTKLNINLPSKGPDFQNSWQDLEGSKTTRYTSQETNQTKIFSMIDLDTKYLKRREFLGPLSTRAAYCLQSEMLMPSLPDEKDHLNNLHQNIKNSVNDRLLPRTLIDSPTIKPSGKRRVTCDNKTEASRFFGASDLGMNLKQTDKSFERYKNY